MLRAVQHLLLRASSGSSWAHRPLCLVDRLLELGHDVAQRGDLVFGVQAVVRDVKADNGRLEVRD